MRTGQRELTVVVCSAGGAGEPWQLPGSIERDRTWIAGGNRTLYEVAVAIASTGEDVELRGEVLRPALEELCDAAGAAVRTGMPPRDASSDDTVVVLDGHGDPLWYLSAVFSPARVVMLLLAPPGLWGWPFVEGPPRPLHEVRQSDVARPEHFRAVAAMGFEMWTNSTGLAEAARAAGEDCAYLGVGQPTRFPEPGPRESDVVFVGDNRWAEDARQVIARLNHRSLEIPTVSRPEMLRLLGTAKVLVLPSRLEGNSRLQREARAMGTVPVALSTNPFADGLDEDGGAVVVDTLEEMPAAVESLLADHDRLAQLSRRAAETSREQGDWGRFVERVRRAFVQTPQQDPARQARVRLAREIRSVEERTGDELRRLKDEEVPWLRRELEAAREEIRRLKGEEVAWLRGEVESLRLERSRLEEEEVPSLRGEKSRLEQEASAREQELASLMSEVETVRAARDRSDERVAEVLGSRSYRYTAPLRRLRELLVRRARRR